MSMEMPPRREIIQPQNDWRPNARYVVEVAYKSTNPIHRAILFTGKLKKGTPANGNKIVNSSYEDDMSYHDVYFLRVVDELGETMP